MPPRRAAIAAGLFLTSLTSSCEPMPAPERSILSVAASQPAAAVTQTEDLSPLRPGVWTYQVTAGDLKGKTATQTLQAVADPEGPWRRTVSATNEITHLARTPDGSLIMPANEILDHDILNHFSPPQLILPPPGQLRPNVPFKTVSQVTSVSRTHPDHVVDHGSSTLTLLWAGDRSVTTPAGTFHCRQINLTLHLKFGLGEVNSDGNLFYADRVGLVAEHYHETGNAFIFHWQKNRDAVLTDYPR